MSKVRLLSNQRKGRRKIELLSSRVFFFGWGRVARQVLRSAYILRTLRSNIAKAIRSFCSIYIKNMVHSQASSAFFSCRRAVFRFRVAW